MFTQLYLNQKYCEFSNLTQYSANLHYTCRNEMMIISMSGDANINNIQFFSHKIEMLL